MSFFTINAQDVSAPPPLIVRTSEQQQVPIPLSTIRSTQILTIQVPEAVSPLELKDSPDSRELGIALHRIDLMKTGSR